MPIVNAGNDQFIAYKNRVELSGTATDKDNDVNTITWSQISGPIQVSLDDIGGLTPSFVTPNQNGEYVFQLHVTDKKGNSASDQVTVEVDNYFGFWKTSELGTMLSFENDVVSTYQYTTAKATTLAQGLCLVSEKNNRAEIEESYNIDMSEDKITLNIEGEEYTRILNDFPDTCLTENLTPVIGDQNYSRDPVKLFNIVWNNINEYYPFFELRNIDQQSWDNIYEELNNYVHNEMTDDEVFELLTALLSSFEETLINEAIISGDGHVSLLRIDPDSDEEEEYSAISTDIISKQLIPECLELTLDDQACESYADEQMDKYLENILGYLDEESVMIMNGNDEGAITAFGQIKDQPIGYLLLQSMADVIPDDVSQEIDYIDAIENIMDEVIAQANENQLESMIIDLRFNGGGYDDVTELIATYFLQQTTDVATIEKRTMGDTIDNMLLSQKEIIKLEPNIESFTGKIAVLTSPITGSAAEVLAGFLSTKEETVTVGQNTRGNFSSELWRLLPNGWFFSQSGEVMKIADAQGKFTNYEGRGYPVTPGLETTFFTKADRDNLVDTGIEKAIEHLSQ